ncbi:hypothetical protein [Aquimarina muelleri]|uniref:Uncharacterized protein n=1 Tax=Aquimarina muelleri TaxID=279356 RepID=A0A918JTY6_9FLAO|nr:hypothetical protein [Aquimarina muelleri]MCX2763000.1 hypothetical protein [Aquimarina muelleri]GGX15354.1 hypothetical protein GCM10007384_16290 [Aquimarina muelleri]
MKRILLILTVLLVTSFTNIINNDIIEVKVTYSGQSDKAYYFTDKETGKILEFTFVSKKAVSKYDLSEKEHIGGVFTITYEVDPIEVQNNDIKEDAEVKKYKQRLILIDINKIEKPVVKN